MIRAETLVPERVIVPDDIEEIDPALSWNCVVWNDPINLMSYVVFVFRKLFGYDETTATKLMLAVHHEGRAVVASGNRERAEVDCYRLHAHGLWATMEKPS